MQLSHKYEVERLELKEKIAELRKRIVIYYRFVGYIEIPPALPRSNYKADTRKGVAVEYVTEPAAK